MLFKDIALRHEVRDLPTLRGMAVHLLTSTAGLMSAQRLSDVFDVSLDLARSSCSHLEEAFLVQLAPVDSLKVAERQRNPQKVHAVDTGLRNAVCLSASEDLGRVAETAAFMALRRLAEDGLFYWRGKGEVDVVRRQGNVVSDLAQVALDTKAEGVLAREIAGLDEAGEQHASARRLLVTGRALGARASEVPTTTRVVPLWRFLLDPMDAGSPPGLRQRKPAGASRLVTRSSRKGDPHRAR